MLKIVVSILIIRTEVRFGQTSETLFKLNVPEIIKYVVLNHCLTKCRNESYIMVLEHSPWSVFGEVFLSTEMFLWDELRVLIAGLVN